MINKPGFSPVVPARQPSKVGAVDAPADTAPPSSVKPADVYGGAAAAVDVKPAATVTDRPAEKVTATYDYVVVGSGPGGGPAAARLAEAGYKVLVLEAGSDGQSAVSEVPALHAKASETPELLTRGTGEFIHHHDDIADDKADPKFVESKDGIFVPRGEGIGGSTLMNANIFVRPDDVDWDNIAQATGDPSWTSGAMLKFFQKVEDAEYQPVLRMLHMIGKGLNLKSLQNLGGHGFDGWLKVNRPLDLEMAKTLAQNPQLARLIGETLAYNFTKVGTALDRVKMLLNLFDPNVNSGNNTPGFVLTPLTVTAEGRRNGPRDRLLDVQAKLPDNLTIRTGVRVQDFVMNDQKEATGVRYRTADGQLHSEAFKRELVLSAGAFETPAILMRSGVAPESQRELLAKNGIDLKVVREGVGQHLRGRYEIGVVQRLKKPLPILTDTDFNADPDNPAYKMWKEKGKGIFAGNGIVAAFRVKSDPRRSEPDLYVFAVPGKFDGYKPGYSTEATKDPNLITWVILDENKGDEKGVVTLDPADIDGHVKVNQKFFDDERPGDSRALVNGIKIVRDLSKRYADMLDREEWPGEHVTSDADLAKAVEENAWDHHPSATAQIGAADDPQSVVDENLKVIGLQGVRVSDASIFRRNMGSFIQSAIDTVSEKAAAELIETAQKQDADGGNFSPWSVTLNRAESSKNTVSDNLFIAMHDTRKVGADGVLTDAALEELFELTALKGFSQQELDDAQAIAVALDATGNPNAKVVEQLAERIDHARADQGFLLDLRARLDDVGRRSTLPSYTWTDKQWSKVEIERWKKDITAVQQTLKAGNADLQHIDRGFHQKQLFGGLATVKVRADVPKFLRFGPFAEPNAELTTAVRFSNGQGCPFKDSAPDVRGAALKIFDQKGEAWDVLMTNQKTSHARDPEQFLKFAKFSAVQQTKGGVAGAAYAAKEVAAAGFSAAESVRIAAQLANDTVLHKVESLTTETFNGGTFRTPDGLLAKVVMMPADDAKALSVDRRDPNWLGTELGIHLPAKMKLGIQVYTGDGKSPDPTDASAVWDGPVYPVADVEIPKPGGKQPELSELINKMAFNPGNGFTPAEMTTARKDIYSQSAANRGALTPQQAHDGLQSLGVKIP